MEPFLLIWAVAAHVESRVTGPIDHAELARAMGMSLAHLRDVFARHTGIPLARYILGRRVANAAFALVHTPDTALDIALRYGFHNADTFTRAFRRVTGMTPSDFRKKRPPVFRKKICAGVFGVSIEPTKEI